ELVVELMRRSTDNDPLSTADPSSDCDPILRFDSSTIPRPPILRFDNQTIRQSGSQKISGRCPSIPPNGAVILRRKQGAAPWISFINMYEQTYFKSTGTPQKR